MSHSLDGLLRQRAWLEYSIANLYSLIYAPSGAPQVFGEIDQVRKAYMVEYRKLDKNLLEVNKAIMFLETGAGVNPSGGALKSLTSGVERTQLVLIDPDGTEVLVGNKKEEE